MVAIRCVIGLAAICSAGFGQKVTFEAVAPKLLEERLRAAPKKQADREPLIEEYFRQAGCGDNLTTQAVKGQKSPNVICRLPGKGPGEIVVGAHFDFRNSGGVVDNWSGAAMLVALFQSLRASERNHAFVFIAFTAEEQGLLGSKSYVRANDLSNVRAMVNVDTLALGDTKVEVNNSDKALLRYLDEMARATNLPLAGVNFEAVGRSDDLPFREKKIPTIAIHSLTQETLLVLHTPKDSLDAVDFEAYQRTYRLLAPYLAYLDLKLD